ncbi:MAG: hypothetical protein HW421_138 [Ignavibacteria bacterium]|nr:hypothetical protein [Ignavibacteria bacterium]
MINDIKKSKVFLLSGAMILAILALVGFLIKTGFVNNPLILILISLFLLIPYRKESQIIRRCLLLASILFVGWLLSYLGFVLLPFFVAFLIAYLCEPFISFAARKGIPRWLSSLLLIIIAGGFILLISIYVFPAIFSQLDDAIRKISSLVTSVSNYLDSRQFYNTLRKLGLPKETLQNVVHKELVPKLQGIFSMILQSLLTLLNSVSIIATQLINVIIIPILSFYFLKDFDKLKQNVKSIIDKKNPKLLNDLIRINRIWKIYISWQIAAAIIIGTASSFFFVIFDVPYALVLGVICGFLNPIPYVGMLMSMVIAIITVILSSPDNVWNSIITIILVINGLHFINSYFLEPNIAGKQVGLHPIILIASLFVFGAMFGIVGLLIAVPTTATLVMFFEDWRAKLFKPKEEVVVVTNEET